jgi:hypothetical protein
MEEVLIDEYFDLLEEWKKYPAYKLETRIDSFVGFVLPKVLEDLKGIKATVIIPELPIRLGTVHPHHDDKPFADRSYKVDFFVRTECGQNIFIEFKSDSGSRREKQDNYLRLSQEVKMNAILEGILKIYKVTTYKNKYSVLLDKLVESGLLNYKDENYKTSIDAGGIRILYVQPRILSGDEDKEVITFDEVAGSIRKVYPDNDLMKRLAMSLDKWSVD